MARTMRGNSCAWRGSPHASLRAGGSANKRSRRLASPGPHFFLVLLDSGLRRVVDALDCGVERLVEVRIALLRGEAFAQRTREAGDHAVLPGETLVGFVA